MRFGLIFSLILAVLAVIFALLNPQPMAVNLIFFETSGSTALVLILTFGFGVLVGLLSTLPKQLRARRELKELRRKTTEDSEAKSSQVSSSSGSSSGSGTPGSST